MRWIFDRVRSGNHTTTTDGIDAQEMVNEVMSHERPLSFLSSRVDMGTQTDTGIQNNVEGLLSNQSNVGANLMDYMRFTMLVYLIIAPAINIYGPAMVLEMLHNVFDETSPPPLALERSPVETTPLDSSESTELMSSPGNSSNHRVSIHHNILFGAEESVSSRVDGHENETIESERNEASTERNEDLTRQNETIERNEPPGRINAASTSRGTDLVNPYELHRHNLYRLLGFIWQYLLDLFH